MSADALRPHRYPLVLLGIVAVVLLWSGVRPKDRLTWWLEVAPVLLAAPLLVFTRIRFPFTPLVCTLICIHAIILCVGGHYTYAEVPPFNWLRDHFHMSRNHYDRVGHFAQGFVPAMVVRELLLRRSPLARGKWLAFVVISICMAISAWYELLEWITAAISGSDAVAFLATQGDQFDTQKDMALCFAGSILSLLLLSRWQDRQMREMETSPA